MSNNDFIDLDTFNEDLDDSVRVPFFNGLKNTTIKVVKLWRPVGIYQAQYDSNNASPTGGSMLSPVKMTLKKRDGLLITLRTRSGSYQQLHVQCTDELWDDILKHSIYKYSDDDIYLKFNDEGVAYEYVVNSKQTPASLGQIPSEEYSKHSRILHVSDALKAHLNAELNSEHNLSKGAASQLDDILGKTVIYKYIPDVGVKIKYASSKVDKEEAQKVMKILEDKINSEEGKDGLKKLLLLGDSAILADVRDDNTTYYVNFEKIE